MRSFLSLISRILLLGNCFKHIISTLSNETTSFFIFVRCSPEIVIIFIIDVAELITITLCFVFIFFDISLLSSLDRYYCLSLGKFKKSCSQFRPCPQIYWVQVSSVFSAMEEMQIVTISLKQVAALRL